MKITTYLFDLDDTIINANIYKEMYPTIIKMIQSKKRKNKDQVELKAKQSGLKRNKHGNFDSGELCKIFKLEKEYYFILKKHIKVSELINNSISKILKKLKNNGKMIGITSNSWNKTIGLYLKKHRLGSYVDFVFCSEHAKCKKNILIFWKKLIKRHNLNPKKCLVIGDNEFEDCEIVKKLGFKSLLIKNKDDFDKLV